MASNLEFVQFVTDQLGMQETLPAKECLVNTDFTVMGSFCCHLRQSVLYKKSQMPDGKSAARF